MAHPKCFIFEGSLKPLSSTYEKKERKIKREKARWSWVVGVTKHTQKKKNCN